MNTNNRVLVTLYFLACLAQAVIPVRAGEPSRARYVATAPSATISWQPSAHIFCSGIYARFFTGTFFDEVPPARDVNFAALWVSYRF